MRKRPLLVVEWDDITTSHPWVDEDENHVEKALHCTSVGWKLKSGRKHLVITPMRAENNDCGDRQIIPRGAIRNIRRIE